VEIRVYYEDTDAEGVVYYANYLKFIERARSQIFFDAGMSPHTDEGFFVVRRVEADYLASARLGEVLNITSRVESMRAASFSVIQEVFRGEEKLFSARVHLAYLNPEYKPTRMPGELRAFLEKEF